MGKKQVDEAGYLIVGPFTGCLKGLPCAKFSPQVTKVYTEAKKILKVIGNWPLMELEPGEKKTYHVNTLGGFSVEIIRPEDPGMGSALVIEPALPPLPRR